MLRQVNQLDQGALSFPEKRPETQKEKKKQGILNGPSIKPATWNIPEHPGTSNNYHNYAKNM